MKKYIISAVLCLVLLLFFTSVGYGQGLVITESEELPEYSGVGDKQHSAGAHNWEDLNQNAAYTSGGGSAPDANLPGVGSAENTATVVLVKRGDYDLLFIQYTGK